MHKPWLTILALSLAAFLQLPKPQQKICVKHIEGLAYPRIAQTAQIAGDVIVRAEVNEKGIVDRATALSGPPLLASYAVENAERWTFTPSSIGSSFQVITYEFKIQNTESFSVDLPDRVRIVAPRPEPEPKQDR